MHFFSVTPMQCQQVTDCCTYYGSGDLAQTRLEEAAGMKFINDSFYVRGDGTCCFYYTEVCPHALPSACFFAHRCLKHFR
jgi:hypothetical protein